MSALKADTAGARRSFPLIDASAEELERRMIADPEIAYRILYDMADKVRAAEERRMGLRRTGRRVKVRMSREQVIREALGPEPSMEPFPRAMKLLMNGRSQEHFARLMNISQGQLSKLLSGNRQPDRTTLEMAAKAGGVTPWYFAEWRSMYLAEWVQMMLEHHPNVSLTLIQSFAPRPEVQEIR